MRNHINKHKRLAAFLCVTVLSVSLYAAAQGTQGEMRRFYNADQANTTRGYVFNFLKGFQINGTDYTVDELNLALAAGDSGGTVTGITAGTTQTQGGATALTGRYNNVTTVGTAGDGVKLPAASAGLKVTVRNSAAANTLKCYPATSDNINALAVNLSVDIPALSETTFTAIDGVTWYSEPTALYLSSPTTLTGGLQIKAAASAGNTTTLITNASQAAARTYTVPDAGGNASFVMTEGAATVNGVKTFGSSPVVPAAGITLGSTTISEAEGTFLDGITAGTFTASRAVSLTAGGLANGVRLGGRVSTLSADGASFADTSEAVMGSGTVTFDANTLVAGDIICFKAAILIDSVDGTDSFRARLRIGGLAGTTIADTTAIASVIANDYIQIEGTIDVRTIGASAAMRGHTSIAGVLGATNFGAGAASVLASSTTQDTTAALTLVVTGIWGGAGNVATLRSFNAWKNS